ncbi:MAG: hypothetical protein QF884_07515, partial [Porticoccaceae bacterium]|nr:hypothetical protein [Porticoccaceae bacterium]
SVYWQDKSNTATFSGRKKLVDKCSDSSHSQCGDNWSTINMFKVGPGGAVFGNDQDDLAGGFNYDQAFEGKFYGLKIYDKFFEPSTDSAASVANATLIYSVSPGNFITED